MLLTQLIATAAVLFVQCSATTHKEGMLHDFPSFVNGFVKWPKSGKSQWNSHKINDFLSHWGTKVLYKVDKNAVSMAKIEFDVSTKGKYIRFDREWINKVRNYVRISLNSPRFSRIGVPGMIAEIYPAELTHDLTKESVVKGGKGLVITAGSHTFRQFGEMYRSGSVKLGDVLQVMCHVVTAVDWTHRAQKITYNIGPDTVAVHTSNDEAILIDHSLSAAYKVCASGEYDAFSLPKNEQFGVSQEFEFGVPLLFNGNNGGIFQGPYSRRSDWLRVIFLFYSLCGDLPWKTWIIDVCFREGKINDGIDEAGRLWLTYTRNGKDYARLQNYFAPHLHPAILDMIFVIRKYAAGGNVGQQQVDKMQQDCNEVLYSYLNGNYNLKRKRSSSTEASN